MSTSDNNLGCPDPHPSPELRRWLYRSPPLIPPGPPSIVSAPRLPMHTRRVVPSPPAPFCNDSDKKWWPRLRLARGGSNPVCLRACRCLHHSSKRLHIRPPTHTTLLHATTLHPYLPPAHTTVHLISISYCTLTSHKPTPFNTSFFANILALGYAFISS